MSVERPSVSVVIPTRLRPELARAVTSVRNQSYTGRIQIVVVVDVQNAEPSPSPDLRSHLDGATVVELAQAKGAAAARNEGVRASRGDWISFLDDDDEWEEDHLHAALAKPVLAGEPSVVATRAIQVVGGKPLDHPTPARPKASIERVGDYLFARRSPTMGRASIFTSTLMARRDAALAVPWREGLARHQDWDWLLELERNGKPVTQVDDVTVRIWVGTANSISASADWKTSLDWVKQRRDDLGRNAYAGFLVAQTLRYAVQSRSLVGIRTVLAEVIRNRTLPWPGSLLFPIGALVPRRSAFGLLRAIQKLGRR